MWLTGPGAPWHVGSSQTRARTRVPCISRQILNHCATREALFFFFKLINLLLAVLGLRFCVRAFFSCGKRGPLFIAVHGPLTIAASLVAGHRLQTRRLSNCGSRAQLLRGTWDLPRPGLEPVSPVLAGRFSTTVPPGKPFFFFLNFIFYLFLAALSLRCCAWAFSSCGEWVSPVFSCLGQCEAS